MKIVENLKSNMNRLVINTANDELEIVLSIGDNVFFKSEKSKLHHNETMLPLLDELLRIHKIKLKDVDQLGVVVGPGSFTGIRVGIATIKAFRDSLGIDAKGINNLDYLYYLAKSQNDKIDTVAIKGSRDSYFVARFINGVLYKYERNLSLEELKQITKGKEIASFTLDDDIKSFAVKFDPKILLKCLDESTDRNLIPVYYQLSQAENEKLKKKTLDIVYPTVEELDIVSKIEKASIKYNSLELKDFLKMYNDSNYQLRVAKLDGEIVGFILIQITDELNITSLAVKKEFRNFGVGTALLKWAENFALLKKLNVLSLEVNSKNLTAYLLYEKFGFEKRRVRKKYYSDGNDCFEMTKNLKLMN